MISLGTKVDDVEVEIDYAIISHFSKHLYSSPNKAVEELVTNGFDAFAEQVHVYIPGPFVTDKVVVWDGGDSMGVDGLKRLWWIARSPKDDGTDRVIQRGDKSRAMIGKFGIGKLASYAVGDRVTHLCKFDGRFLSVSVAYGDVPKLGDLAAGQDNRFTTPIMELTEAEVRQVIEEAFDTDKEPGAWELFDRESWTIAFIDQLRPDIKLTPGRLRWVISNGMPLRPDFAVSVNDEDVEPKLAKDAVEVWDMSNPDIQESIQSAWKSQRDAGAVTGDVSFGTDDEGRPEAVFPTLGAVRGQIRLFAESLHSAGDEESRVYGFFILVRGRLLNADDPELFLKPPSYGTFYRCQYELEVDGLDPILLADREHVVDSVGRRELQILQTAVYRQSRIAIEDRDITKEKEERPESLLPTGSREQYRGPLSALLSQMGADAASTILASPTINNADVGADAPISSLTDDFAGFRVNTSHPFIDSIRETVGSGKKAREILRIVDLLATAERLMEGYLLDIGLPVNQVAEIVRWRDGVLRTLGARLKANPEEICRHVAEASYEGEKEFENALAELFRAMGFVATRDGAPGQKDILVIAPVGQAQFSFTVEAKGSVNPLPNDGADLANAGDHRDQVGAAFAIVVAREFVGFKQASEAQVLKDCRAVSGDVSIVTVETLVALYRVVHEFALPLELIPDLLKEVEAPADKLKRVEDLSRPTDQIDWRRLLEEIWSAQNSSASGDVVPYRSIWQDSWRDQVEIEQFTLILTSLETLAGGLIRVDTTREHVTLRQSPDLVAEEIVREPPPQGD